MMMFWGLQNSDPVFPSVPAGNCGGFLHACGGATYSNGTLQFGVLFPRDTTFGIVGVAPGVRGSDIYLWNPWWPGYDSVSINSVIYGVNSAVQSGVKVIYTDIIHGQNFATEAAAFAQAIADSMTIVTGMWVSGRRDSVPYYPGGYPNVINVSGVTPTGAFAGAGTCDGTRWATGSDYGPTVTLAAPISAYTTYGNGAYYDLWNWWQAHICNASLSAAHVAGVAALLRSLHPNWTSAQITQALVATASGGGARINDYVGYGVVNAAAAVGYAPPPPPPFYVNISGPNPVLPDAGCLYSAMAMNGTEPLSYAWQANGVPVGDDSPSLRYWNDGSDFRLYLVVTDADGRMANNAYRVSVDPGAPECLDMRPIRP